MNGTWRTSCGRQPNATAPNTRSTTSPSTSPGGPTSTPPVWPRRACHYALDLDGPPGHRDPGGALTALREKASQALGRRPEPGLLLLHDLKDLYLAAAENSLHWEMLAQTAQATREPRLLELASSCHPRTLRQVRWANTTIKNLSPQILGAL